MLLTSKAGRQFPAGLGASEVAAWTFRMLVAISRIHAHLEVLALLRSIIHCSLALEPGLGVRNHLEELANGCQAGTCELTFPAGAPANAGEAQMASPAMAERKRIMACSGAIGLKWQSWKLGFDRFLAGFYRSAARVEQLTCHRQAANPGYLVVFAEADSCCT